MTVYLSEEDYEQPEEVIFISSLGETKTCSSTPRSFTQARVSKSTVKLYDHDDPIVRVNSR